MKIEELYAIYLQYPSIQTDTRKLQPNDLFFALKGPNFNGNNFAKKALHAGAALAVIDEEEYAIHDKIILVDNVLETLQALATHHRRQLNIPFIAITGSNGKTTTKELVHVVLSTTYTTYTTEGNLNNHIGVPLTILKIKSNAQMAVIEMGANHLGEIASYCLMAQPTHGVITNCGKAHLEGFGSEEGVRKAKGELYDYLKKTDGTIFLMQDYAYLQQMSAGITHKYTYGTTNADIVGAATALGSFLTVQFTKGIGAIVKTALAGTYNLPNVLAAAAIGTYFTISEKNIVQALTAYAPSNSRSQLIQKGNHKIVLDAYNANPSSMKAAIENLAVLGEENKVLVLGAMAELGANSLMEHEDIIREISKYSWKAVLLVGGDFLKSDHPYLKLSSAAEAGTWLQQQNLKGTYMLIKGSRSMQMEKVLDYL